MSKKAFGRDYSNVEVDPMCWMNSWCFPKRNLMSISWTAPDNVDHFILFWNFFLLWLSWHHSLWLPSYLFNIPPKPPSFLILCLLFFCINWIGWMTLPIQWTWTWANSGRWWGTGRPGVLQSMGLQSQMIWGLNANSNNGNCLLFFYIQSCSHQIHSLNSFNQDWFFS